MSDDSLEAISWEELDQHSAAAAVVHYGHNSAIFAQVKQVNTVSSATA